MLELSNFLRDRCGIHCEIDQYHMNDNIVSWGVWNEERIKELAKCNGYVLLICSPTMYQQLSHPGVSRIEMRAGHIDSLALNNLIRDQATTHCVIPVCLEELNRKIVPVCLCERKIYSISYSTLMQVNSNADVESILEISELESLKSLVYRLKGLKEFLEPPLGKVYYNVWLMGSYRIGRMK